MMFEFKGRFSVIENIDNKRVLGMYAGFKVVMLKENYYVNATKLCSDNFKDINDWLRQDQTRELISDLDRSLQTYRCISNYTDGMYVHIDLLPFILSWLSVKTKKYYYDEETGEVYMYIDSKL